MGLSLANADPAAAVHAQMSTALIRDSGPSCENKIGDEVGIAVSIAVDVALLALVALDAEPEAPLLPSDRFSVTHLTQ